MTDSCWCYTDAEISTLYTWFQTDYANGFGLTQELSIVQNACMTGPMGTDPTLRSCCNTCGTAIVNDVWW